MRRMHRTGEGPRPREARGPVPASRTAGREARATATRTTGSGRRRPSCGRNAPPLRLVSAGVLACSVHLAGCGGGDSGTGIPGATPPEGTATYHEVTDPRRPGGYAFSGRLRDAVRIGIEDSPADFTHPVFHGRVQLEGAAFAYWRPLAGQPTQQAFASCTAGRLCRVFRVDSRGDPARLQDLARTVLEHAGLPATGDRWFLHDSAGGSAGWYELPAAEDLEHGTLVALVAAGRRFHPFPAPDPVIVPMALNFDEQLEGQHYFSDLIAASNRDPDLLAELDREHAAKLRRQHEATDIINASYGVPVNLGSVRGKDLLRIWLEDYRLLRCGPDPLKSDPADCAPPTRPDETTLTWAEYTQMNSPESERTLRVWAAGNHSSPGAGFSHRNLYALGPFYFPELRGQHIAVTALSAREGWLAPYANPCGDLPADWDASRFGKHFCLAAPGTLSEDVQGTSFAAPFVSGVLARMMERFPNVTPRELVKKLMDTADDWFQDGFNGDVYVGEVEVKVNPGEPPTETKTAVVPSFPSISIDVTGTDLGGHVVIQRRCRASSEGYIVSTDEVDDLCVVWGTTNGTVEEATAEAGGRFRFLFGAGGWMSMPTTAPSLPRPLRSSPPTAEHPHRSTPPGCGLPPPGGRSATGSPDSPSPPSTPSTFRSSTPWGNSSWTRTQAASPPSPISSPNRGTSGRATRCGSSRRASCASPGRARSEGRGGIPWSRRTARARRSASAKARGFRGSPGRMDGSTARGPEPSRSAAALRSWR